MRTSDDVRAALFALEDDAPTLADVLDQLKIEDDRPARRHGWLVPAAAAVAVAAAAVLAVVLSGHPTGPTAPAASGGAVDLSYGFSVAPVSGFAFTRGSIAEGLQERGIATASGLPIGTIQAGGSHLVEGRSALQDRRPIIVSGHRAYFGQQALELPTPAAVSDDTTPGQWTTTVPVVAWPDRPGHWLIVRAAPHPYGPVPSAVIPAWGADVRARLTAIAAAIRPAVPSALRIPFRLAGAPAKITTLTAASDTDPRTPGGSAIVTEFGMEVTVDVSRPVTEPPADPAATTVKVGTYTGRVNTRCAVQPAPAPGGTSSHADCELVYRVQQWQVEVFVTGPGGGSRPITTEQFVDLARHLRLASNPSDPSTWFDASTALP
jgi:hypothetical protein